MEMTGCDIIRINAIYSEGKPIKGLVDSPIDRLRTLVVNQARKDKQILINWFEANEIANKVILYPL